MKRIFIGIAAAALALSLAGCGSTSGAAASADAGGTNQNVGQTAQEPRNMTGEGALDWDGREFGEPYPDWVKVVKKPASLRKLPEFDGYQVIGVAETGQDRDLVFADIKARKALAEFSTRIKASVKTEAEAGLRGDKEADEGTAAKVTEDLVRAVSNKTFSGLEEISTFWVLVRTATGGTEYRCYALYGMNDDLYERQVSKVIDVVKSQALTEEEQTLLDKLDAMTWELELED